MPANGKEMETCRDNLFSKRQEEQPGHVFRGVRDGPAGRDGTLLFPGYVAGAQDAWRSAFFPGRGAEEIHGC